MLKKWIYDFIFDALPMQAAQEKNYKLATVSEYPTISHLFFLIQGLSSWPICFFVDQIKG
jgi:hypothetical protein